jgi:hypothetical protein
MARKVRIAALGTVVVTALVVAIFGGAYYALRQVRPFYEQALKIEPEVLERGSRELESRATALYSDAQRSGEWQALFTAEQINGWLATQLAENMGNKLPANIRDPRVAIARDVITLGFRTSSGGVETVASVDASVSLTETGAIAIRFISVRAGALPLPVLQLADELAKACQDLNLPVRWTRQDGKPVAIVEIQSDESLCVDAIQLNDGELYVAGHTGDDPEIGPVSSDARPSQTSTRQDFALDNFELRLTPTDERSALELARRPVNRDKQDAGATGR